MNTTEKAFSEAISSYVDSSSKVLVAFSGGCDSLALLALCTSILGPKRCVAVYVNHNIRDKAELEKEIALNKENCRKLGVKLIVRTIDDGLVKRLSELRKGGIEDAARAIRYEILQEERQNESCTLILTAHHRQDQIETVVMHLQKGSPMTSLRGISVYDQTRRILRPLLGFSRAELESYLNSKGLEWSTDTSNEDQSFRRNLIRHSIIPQISQTWPGFDDAMLDLGYQAEVEYSKALKEVGFCERPDMDLDRILSMGLVARTVALFGMWDHVFAESELPMTLLDRVLDAICEKRDCTIGSNMAIFSIYHGRLYLTNPKEDEMYSGFEVRFDPSVTQAFDLPGGMRFMTGTEASACVKTCKLDESALLRMESSAFGPNPRLRFARVGDVIRLKSGNRMVMRLLQDMKVPQPLRFRVPVIEDDEGICAVFGTVFGGKDRICVKFRTSLAPNSFPIYIVSKG
ncbi:MAG: tRNA lysidine(34) synthetase TilS [Spirochaetales bacterium]|nr:tRNA lysidine(34) synthetase TilS [Spirochaetales bacterium]